VLAVCTFSLCFFWKNDFTIASNWIRQYPDHHKGYAVMGGLYYHAGSYAKARDYYLQSQQRQDLATRMGALEETYRTPDTDSLDGEIEALQKSIDQRNYLLQQFDNLVLRNRGGFANQFQTLASLHLPGLWLEGVTVNGDSEMEIRGMTLDPKLVPIYLQKLGQHGELSGATFETVSMTRISDDPPYVQFVLRNVAEDSTWQ
jgi:hypothetical protein